MSGIEKLEQRRSEPMRELERTAPIRERALEGRQTQDVAERLRGSDTESPGSRLTSPSAPQGPSLRRGQKISAHRLLSLTEKQVGRYQRRIQSQAQLARLVDKLSLEVAVVDRPAGGSGTTTGDHYTGYRMADGRIAFVVGDGMGHDAAAARDSATLAAHLADDGVAAKTFTVGVTADIALARLSQDVLPHFNPRDRMMAAALLIVDPVRGQIDFANAGLPVELLIRKASGEVVRISQRGGPLGDSDFGYDATHGHHQRQLDLGDTIVLPTDGLADAMVPDSAEHNLTALAERLARAPSGRPDMLAKELHRAAGATGSDDATALILRWRRAAGRPTT